MIHLAGNTSHGCLPALIEQRKLNLTDDLCLTDADTLLKNRPNQNSFKFRGTSGQKAALTSLQLNTIQCIMTTINYIKLHFYFDFSLYIKWILMGFSMADMHNYK